MNITICGHRKAVEILENHPKQKDVLFISSPIQKFAVSGSHKIADLAKEYCEILFDDIEHPRERHKEPQLKQIEKALEFAKGRADLIVCCQAGISRSSGTAYVIQSSEVGAEKALEILNPKIHMPNRLVVKHGADILKLPEMIDWIDRWRFAADQANWDDPFEI